jgi:hypothetical protein
MALPNPSNSEVFSPDQRVKFRAFYWDTTTTPVRLGSAHAAANQRTAHGSGLEYAQFDLLTSSFPVTGGTAAERRNSIETKLAQASNDITKSVLGYSGGAYRTGVVPMIYSYWGAGAPPGGSRNKATLLKFTGIVRQAVASCTLVFAGQGTVAAFVTRTGSGTVEQILAPSTIKEPNSLVDLTSVTAAKIKSEWGYQFNETPMAFAVGDRIDVYYWHNGESWGGIAAKVIPSAVPTTNADAFLAAVRGAAVLGTSFMGKENNYLPALQIPYLVQSEIAAKVGDVSEMKMEVALTLPNEPTGFRLATTDGEFSLVDNANNLNVLRKGRLVHFEGGYHLPLEATTNLVPLAKQDFTGNATVASAGVTLTQGQTIPGVTNGGATRIQTTGGTSTAKYRLIVDSGISGNPATLSVFVRNNSTKRIRFQMINPTLTGEYIQVGETKRITISQVATTSATREFRIVADSIADDLDVLVFQPQIEDKAYATPFTLGTRAADEMYPRFTGFIDDIFPNDDGETAVIVARGIESKLAEVFDENNPDRLDYHAHGYILRERSVEPVFGVPAFDCWPLEVAAAVLCYKAGIDSYTLGIHPTSAGSNVGKFCYREARSGNNYFGAKQFAARRLADPTKMIPLERQNNYGNVAPLQKDYLPNDDEYLFRPEVTQRNYDRLKALTDHYGFDFFGSPDGQLVLTARNNPIAFQYLTQSGTYSTATDTLSRKVAIGAVGGVTFSREHHDPALHFDGTDDTVTFPAYGSWNGVSQFSVEAWVSNEEATPAPTRMIWTGASTANYLNLANGRLRLSLSISSTQRTVTDSVNLPTGTAIHVAGTYDGTFLRIYVNGVLRATSDAFPGTVGIANTGTNRIGEWVGQSYWRGKIAYVRIWTAARTEAQLLANISTRFAGNETGLVANIVAQANGTFTNTSPNATAFTYNGPVAARLAAPGWSRVLTGRFSRLDLYAGIGQEPSQQLIADAADLLNHTSLTTGTAAQISSATATLTRESSTYRVQFSRTGTSGSDFRLVSPSLTVDKSKPHRYTVEMRVNAATTALVEMFVEGTAVNAFVGSIARVLTLNTNGTLNSVGTGVTLISNTALADGFRRLTVELTPAFWGESTGSTCVFSSRTGSTTTATYDFEYRRPSLTALPNNGGRINVLIEANDGAGNWSTVSNSTISTFVADTAEAYYYDSAVRSDGTNAAVFRILQLPLDQYRVTLTPAGPEPGQTACVYRLNGVAVYERDPEQSYYHAGTTLRKFSTLEGILKLDAESNAKDLRNHVVVVGQRKATLTDSAKAETNESNSEYEFHVAVAVDPYSIYDPTSSNFVGGKRMSLVFDEKVADSDFARWLSRVILHRYRLPKTTAKFEHTAIPMLELRDAVYVTDERDKTVDHLLWVTSYSESWSVEEATTSVEAVAHPEIPSYQPREDIDIDSLFVDPRDGTGDPVINMKVSYRNLMGRAVTNATLTNATGIKGFFTKAVGTNAPMISEAISNANTMTLANMAIPSTMYLAMNVTHNNNTAPVQHTTQGYSMTRKRVLVNNPYRHFFYVSAWNTNNRPTLAFTFHEGDGTASVYDKTYYNFPTGAPTTDTPADTALANDQWYVCYDHLKVRTGENPFYDPYTSEIGNLVNLSFDLLVSGRLRVSIWDANASTGYETPVAWLTAPAADPEEPESHWQYMESGRVTLGWDGVDNIGFWNTLQSAEWSESLKGAFGDKPMAVSRGFYAWNDKSTNLFTLIGDTSTENFDSANSPYFTIGRFGQFYVKVEVLNDDLVRKDIATRGVAEPRVVDSKSLPTVSTSGNTMNDVTQTFVWTHLGEPSKSAIRVQEWVGSGSWTPGRVTTGSDWSAHSTPAADASFFVGKPVRFTFVPRARVGVLFERADRVLDANKTSLKLTRQVHLKATVFDQFWKFSGRSWQDFHSSYDVGAVEQKRLASRMYHNDDHALEWEDESWRTGESLAAFEWIFDPAQFKKDWGTGLAEALRYGDFEQLETLPGFDSKQLGGTSIGERAHMMLAYMSYLFYMSASTLDRSGRRQWCLNSWTDSGGARKGFIDKSKIVSSTWRAATEASMPWAIVDYEQRGAENYLVRSIFVRQWKESYWTAAGDSRSPVNRWGISNVHQLRFVQPLVADFNPRRKFFVDATNAKEDRWLLAWATDNGRANRMMHAKSGQNLSGGTARRTLDIDTPTVNASFMMAPTAFGTWTFDRSTVAGWFTPNPCRDFHPYWRYPFMPDAAMWHSFHYTRDRASTALDVLSCAASQAKAALRDPAARDIWYGYAFSETYALINHNAYGTGNPAMKWYHYGARLERTVEEQGAERNGLDVAEIPHIFDYSREDNLDRFDQYRGVISRAPYSAREDGNELATWKGNTKRRAGSPAPVKPSGVYLLNLGRYNFYTLSAVHEDFPTSLGHWVDGVEDWFDIRFRHEYVWYSDRYFPVSPRGGSLYGYTRNEYTKALEWVGVPWWGRRTLGGIQFTLPSARKMEEVAQDVSRLHFDPGAWTGWKDDVWVSTLPTYASSAQFSTWTAFPRLRWQEIEAKTRRSVLSNVKDHGHGGFNATFATSGTATGTQAWLHSSTNPSTSRRHNIFDEHYAEMRAPRLAVGPELGESRGLVMNLVLPDRLRG